MRETAVLFGPGGSLAGIVTEPNRGVTGRPAVLLLNAGLLHRIGPSRVYVRMARMLASAGFMVLRFDFSGIGDSDRCRDDVPRPEGVLREAREAMKFLAESRGVDQFVTIGLCWGATSAFRIACHDPRVVAAVMIDWYAYRTFGYYLHHYGARLFKVKPWYGFFAGRSPAGRRLRRTFGVGGGHQTGNPLGMSYARQFPPKKAVLSDLHGLAGRGVDLFFIYSGGGMENWYNYRAQFKHMFPSLRSNKRMRVEFFGEADHTFTLLRHQDALVTAIDGWARTVFARLEQDRRPVAKV